MIYSHVYFDPTAKHFWTSKCNTDVKDYSSSHIVQITDFLEYLHEYCMEKSETCAKFQSSFVVTKNIKMCFWTAAPVKNWHKNALP